jgi:hypothetical protein
MQRNKRIILGTIVILICINNIASMLLFVFTEYLRRSSEYIADIVVTTLFFLEFIFLLVRTKGSRLNLLKQFDFWIDLITIITPFLIYSMDSECDSFDVSEYEVDTDPNLYFLKDCFD